MFVMYCQTDARVVARMVAIRIRTVSANVKVHLLPAALEPMEALTAALMAALMVGKHTLIILIDVTVELVYSENSSLQTSFHDRHIVKNMLNGLFSLLTSFHY